LFPAGGSAASLDREIAIPTAATARIAAPPSVIVAEETPRFEGDASAIRGDHRGKKEDVKPEASCRKVASGFRQKRCDNKGFQSRMLWRPAWKLLR
jgi:hypothetical protein